MYTQAYRSPSTWGAAHDPSGMRSLAKGLLSFLPRLARSIRTEIRSRRAVAELAALDDRMLRDIGISRCDIEHSASVGRRHGDHA
ncbi:MAG: DUF1127 domain-containing protein [Microvirga sp.]